MNAEPVLEPEEQAKSRTGQVLSGKWRLERLLGVGGMAAVYAAKHENNDRAAAIKVLHLEASLNQEVKRRFLREGYIANKVQHPGAVAVLDDGVTEDGAAYIVMELCVGETLHEHVERLGFADEPTVLRWVDGLLDVLALAHREGIVHRDLKPDNVFVLEGGGVKVLDFGIARIRVGLSDLQTQAGLVLGTPAFMPPEQARGQSQRVDGRADLWAVGAIMLAALTGKRVHTAKSPQECLFLAMTEHAKDMAELAPELSPKVAAIIDKALQFELEDRWDDASAMQTAVRSVLAAYSREPTMLAKPETKPAWPPAPVLPGPPVVGPSAPKLLAAPVAGEASAGEQKRPSKAPTKIETPAAPVAASPSDAPPAAALPPRSDPPPPVHLQAEARSLEAGSPLLETNRKGRRGGVLVLIALLVAGSFGIAFAIQSSADVRQALGLETEPASSAQLPSTSSLGIAPTPSALPSTVDEMLAAVPITEPSTDTVELGDEVPDAAAATLDAGAKPTASAQRPKPPAKKPPAKKPLPKKKRKH